MQTTEQMLEALATALSDGDREEIAKNARLLRDHCDAEGVLSRHLSIGSILDAMMRSPLLTLSHTEEPLLRCPDCGSLDCEMSAWVSVNNPNVVSPDEGPSEEVFCPQCEEHFSYSCLTDEPLCAPGIDNDDGDTQEDATS